MLEQSRWVIVFLVAKMLFVVSLVGFHCKNESKQRIRIRTTSIDYLLEKKKETEDDLSLLEEREPVRAYLLCSTYYTNQIRYILIRVSIISKRSCPFQFEIGEKRTYLGNGTVESSSSCSFLANEFLNQKSCRVADQE